MTTLTPVILQADALLALHAANPQRYPVLLQSAAESVALGQFDILFACPQQQLTLNGDGSLAGNAPVEVATGFLETLDTWWRQERTPRTKTQVPFVGGWFLFLSYELAGEIEPSLALPKGRVVAQATRIPAAVIVRHIDGAAWIVEEEGSLHTPQILSDVKSLTSKRESQHRILASELAEEPEEIYLQSVRTALEHIAAGDIYQANLSRRWSGKLTSEAKPHEVYRRLRSANPAPFAALAVFENFAIVSSSPERLIEVRDSRASARPIAGTRPRRIDRSDDVARLQELHSHPKERAEHIMLIDLVRNDLGRICAAGTVEVDEFMTLESYAHVHHIVSNVSGELRADVTPGQAIAAIFPGGTITGCPKVRCMRIIAELEQRPRGAYTGSMGYLNRDGSMDLNILIRTLEISGPDICFRAGAGIVADSIPERELDETHAKARGLIRALEE